MVRFREELDRKRRISGSNIIKLARFECARTRQKTHESILGASYKTVPKTNLPRTDRGNAYSTSCALDEVRAITTISWPAWCRLDRPIAIKSPPPVEQNRARSSTIELIETYILLAVVHPVSPNFEPGHVHPWCWLSVLQLTPSSCVFFTYRPWLLQAAVLGGLCRTRQRQRHASVSSRSAAPDLVSLHPPAGRRRFSGRPACVGHRRPLQK